MAQDDTPATDASKEDAPLTTTATNAILPKAVPRWQEACGAFDVSFAVGDGGAPESLRADAGAFLRLRDELWLEVSGVAWLEAGEAAQWQWSLKTGGPKHQDVRFSARFLAGGERGLMARLRVRRDDDARFAPGAVVALVFENDARLKPRELWARVGTCDGAAAAAAAVAAAESAARRPRPRGDDAGSLGDRLAGCAEGATLVRVAVASDDELPPPAKRTSVTGLHVRDKLKAALGKDDEPADGGPTRAAALARIGELEAQLADCAARADAALAAAGALDEVLKTQDDDRMRALKRKLDAAVRKLEVQLARLDEAAAGDDSPRTSIAGADGTTLL
ncbi:hypothetical protein JL720_10469 [Aureococcus anophagefferens]|nr:hypothetical protein JL720_10469 [Aureococcus anophagefferens]